jgi:hypothetical protein
MSLTDREAIADAGFLLRLAFGALGHGLADLLLAHGDRPLTGVAATLEQHPAVGVDGEDAGCWDLPLWPVALARSQACAASSARYMSTGVAPVYSSPHGIVCLNDKLESSPHACAASSAALRS